MRITREQQSMLSIAAGFSLFAFLLHKPYFYIPAAAGAISLPFSFLNKPLHRVWMGIADVLGFASRNILLTIIFYFFLTPLSWIRRGFAGGKTSFNIPRTGSTFITREHDFTAKDLENPW